MATSGGLKLYFVMTLACAAPACSASNASSAPSGEGGAAPSTGGASSGAGAGGAAQGGSAGAGGSSGDTQGGSGGLTAPGMGGSGGSAQGGSGGSSSGVDLSGTWTADVQTVGTLTVPLAGTVNANLRFVIRLVVTGAADTLNATFDICKLTVVTTPDPKTLSVTFTPAVVATLSTSVSESAPVVNVGDAIPIPAITIRSGIDSSGSSIDADADSHPGVTIPANVGGALPLNAYSGLTIQASLSPTLTAPDGISGTATFSAVGKVFGSDNPLLTSGDITVAPQSKDVPFTANRLSGDVPCAEVLKAFP